MECREFQTWLAHGDHDDREQRLLALEHAGGCPECLRLLQACPLDVGDGERTPQPPDRQAELERLVSVSLDRGWGSRRLLPLWLIRLFSMLAGAAAVILVFMLMPDTNSTRVELARALVEDHLRHNFRLDLQHPVELEPWLTANAGFPARLPREQPDGDRGPLVGVAVCEIDSVRAVHLVFRYRVGLMSLYIIGPGEGPPGIDPAAYRLQVNNYQVTVWKEGEVLYASVK